MTTRNAYFRDSISVSNESAAREQLRQILLNKSERDPTEAELQISE